MNTQQKLLMGAMLTLLCPEIIHWAAAHKSTMPRGPQGTCAIFVLGFPARADGTAHPMQRDRVEVAVDAMNQARCTKMIFSGGNPHSSAIEADVMADLAITLGIPNSQIVRERRARNTWENVRYSLAELKGYGTVYLVSDSLHVLRGKKYLCRQDRDICSQTQIVSRYRFGQFYAYKCWSLFHEGVAAIRDAVLY